MRRYFMAAAILSIVAGGPLQALAGDREIAEQIIQKLKVQRDAGALKDFTLDLKVDKGIVLLRGNVREAGQKESVLAAAKGIADIVEVVDEISVSPIAKNSATKTDALAQTATVVRPNAAVTAVAEPKSKDSFSFEKALAAANTKPTSKPAIAPVVIPPAVAQASKPESWQQAGQIAMAGATESTVESDRNVTSAVVAALGEAQRQGRLKGFGVDVNTQDGRVFLNGRASSEAHRQLIADIVRQTPGVADVVEEIAVYNSTSPIPQPVMESGSNEPTPITDYASNLTPIDRSGTPAIAASTRPSGVPVQTAPYQMNPAGMQAMPAGMPMNGGMMGAPVPMAPYAGGAAAPRYEQPYLPNYAWPGYAAYPNYAAVTYPQQYSPSAFPYIGPFYPYPQVPLGWRKVSLEWDDGWWFLDFTDR